MLIRTGMGTPSWLLVIPGSVRAAERLIEVGEDVVDVLDPDAQPDHLGPNAGLLLFFGGHLAVGRRRGMAGERFGVADIDEALEQLEAVIEALAGLEPSSDSEGQERAGLSAEIFLRQRVIGAVVKARIVDPGDASVVAQEVRHPGTILDMAFDPQRDRLDALEQQERIEWRQD